MPYRLIKTEDYNKYVIRHFIIDDYSDCDSIVTDYATELYAGWMAIQLVDGNTKKYMLDTHNTFYEVFSGGSPSPYDVATFTDTPVLLLV